MSRLKAIACVISRGGFSDERVFSFAVEQGEHKGIASRRHMWNEAGRPVEGGEPPLGQEVNGFVAAKVLQVDIAAGTATVSIPDGEVVTLPLDRLVNRPLEAEANVPV